MQKSQGSCLGYKAIRVRLLYYHINILYFYISKLLYYYIAILLYCCITILPYYYNIVTILLMTLDTNPSKGERSI